MNVKELKDMLDAAFDRGIDPYTEIVIDLIDTETPCEWSLVSEIHDPTLSGNDGHIWFTIVPAYEEADGRFTPGHYNDD